jgi:nucleoside-triphosphatase THEP1
MSTKIQIIKRLEIIKNFIELEDEDMIHLQIDKLKSENNTELNEIIKILINDDYEKINKAIDDYVYGYKNAELTPHQKEVFDKVVQDIDAVLKSYSISQEHSDSVNFISLSGSAGVGKTFVTSKLVEEFLKKEYKVLLTTPTHKSLSVAKYMINSNNIHINAKTLQSYLDLRLDTDYLRGTKTFKRDKKDLMHDFERNLDILIVDESSMVSNELLGFIEENLHQHKLKTVLFIGDQYQLPPIDEGENGVVSLPKQYKLTEIVRQAKDSYVKMIANEIKECIRTKNYTPILNILDTKKYPKLKIFHNQTEFLEAHTKLDKWYTHNNKVLAYGNDRVDEQNRILRYRYWHDQNIVPTGWVIPGELLIANQNYKNKIMNSELITVATAQKLKDKYLDIFYWQCVDTIGRIFAFVDPDDTVQYNEKIKELGQIANKLDKYKEPEKRKKAWRNYFITKEKYGDFKYVFANTIHKSQGSTYNQVYINIDSILSLINRNDKDIAYRLLYVAVTRASKDVILLT